MGEFRFKWRCVIANRVVIFLVMLVVSGARSMASSTASLDAGSWWPAEPEAHVRAEQWIADKGWVQGWDTRSRRLVIVGTSVVEGGSGDLDFIRARNSAFQRAFTSAQRTASQFLAAEIHAALQSRSSLVQVVGDRKIGSALELASSSGHSIDERSLSEAVSLAARASLVGMTTGQTFVSRNETRAEVAIVAVWGPAYAAVARGTSAPASTGQSLVEWFRGRSDEELLSTWGHRLVRDVDGVLRPVAFGSATVRSGFEEATFENVRSAAVGGLARFSGEQLASSEASLVVSQAVSVGVADSAAVTVANYESVVDGFSSVDDLRVEMIGRRIVRDPASGTLVAVGAFVARPSGSVQSEALSPAVVGHSLSQGEIGCPPVSPRMSDHVRAARCIGVGSDESSAIADALLEAVRRQGVQIEGDSRTSRRFSEAFEEFEGEVHEKVIASSKSMTSVRTFSTGFVHSYEVVEREVIDDLVQVEICANLVEFDPANPRFGLSPTIAVLPWSVGIPGVVVDGVELNVAGFLNDAEDFFEHVLLRSERFMVLDERSEPLVRAYREEIRTRAAAGEVDERELIKIGRALTADFLLIGEVDEISVVDESASNGASRRVLVNIGARLVGVAENRIIWADSSRLVMSGRDLALARAGLNPDRSRIDDGVEAGLSPADLGLLRACRQLRSSLQRFLDTVPIRDGVRHRFPSVLVLDISGREVLLEEAADFLVGMMCPLENPVSSNSVVPSDSIEFRKIGSIRILGKQGPFLRGIVVDGDVSLIELGRSRVVLESD